MSPKIRIDFARVKKLLTYVLLAILAIGSIIFAEMKGQEVKCTGIVIKLDSENERPLLSKKDIDVILTNEGTDHFLGRPIDEISLHQIEQRVKKIPLVKSCEAHYDFSGRLIVSVKEYSPIARILHFTAGESNYKDQYVTQEGKFIGTSALFTPRVLLASGPFFSGKRSNLLDARGKTLIPLFEFINNNEFWRAQITQVIVAEDGGVVLVPAIGQTYIDFGLPVNIVTKFKKLDLFYKKIIPNKGWNTYHWVHLKYKNQLICD